MKVSFVFIEHQRTDWDATQKYVKTTKQNFYDKQKQ